MQHNKMLKYILDIESIIAEIDAVCKMYGNDFERFKDDFLAKRAVERQLEIIGEAVNHLTKLDRSLQITGAKHIIGLRNIIIHSYDTVDPAILWGIIQKDIPVLKKELQQLRNQ